MQEIIVGVSMFTLVILALVLIILAAKKSLVSSGDVKISINGDENKSVTTQAGGKLLGALANSGIFVPSACGGGGTCGQCLCKVKEGGGSLLPTEEGHINKREAREGYRLSCQVNVKQDMDIELPEEVFGVQKWECEVVSNDNKATFIKELKLKLPEGESVPFRAGGYIQIECPPYKLKYSEFDIDPEYHPDWDHFKLWDVESEVTEPVMRAYSMANYPEEKGVVKFNIRVASPPPGTNFPPGQMSSWVFGLKPGDKVTVYGPFGEFFAKDTDNEMVFIGGGAGMAPLRSHLFHLFHTLKTRDRKVSYWYGGRAPRELFYIDDFRQIEAEFDNFSFYVTIDFDPKDPNWVGKESMDDTNGNCFFGFVMPVRF